MSDVYTRVLLPADAQNLREVRLEALRKDGRLFASSYEIESKFPFENWERKCTEDDKHCAMGLFNGTGLIGISLVLPYDKDTSGKTGLLGQSYIKHEYRGKGLGNLLYAARMKWILEKSGFNSAVVYVRDGNGVSITLNRKAGAQYLETREMMCGDGQLALWHWYEFPLDSASCAVSKTLAPSRFPGLWTQTKRLWQRRAISLWGLRAARPGLGGVLSISTPGLSPSQHTNRAYQDD
jgi:hypothetical protein